MWGMTVDRLSAGQLGSHWASYLCVLMWLHVRIWSRSQCGGHGTNITEAYLQPYIPYMWRVFLAACAVGWMEFPNSEESPQGHKLQLYLFRCFIFIFNKMINDKHLSCSKTNSIGLSASNQSWILANLSTERTDDPQASWSPSEVLMCKRRRFLIV